MSNGTNGNDTLSASAIGAFVDGGRGNDFLDTGYNQTTLVGGAGLDSLYASLSASDFDPNGVFLTIDAGGGNDRVLATLSPRSSESPVQSQAQIDLGGGADSLNLWNNAEGASGSSAQTVVTARAGANDLIVTTQTGFPQLSGNTATTNIVTGSGADTISTTTNSQNAELVLSSGAGADQIDATLLGAGVSGSAGVKAVVDAGAGNDLVGIMASASSGDAYYDLSVLGGGGSDTLSSTFDSPYGTQTTTANVYMNGGAGSDRLYSRFSDTSGTAGATIENVLMGGRGNDYVAASITSGVGVGAALAALNMVDGGTGSDTIMASVRISDGRLNDGVENKVLGGSGSDLIFASINAEGRGPALSGKNTIFAGAGHDDVFLTGGALNYANGGNGNDYMASYGGDVWFVGGAGRDTLLNGTGDTTLTGGTGGDVFTLGTRNAGTTSITDWNRRFDKLDFGSDFSDSNGNGLADEIDAATAITDDGSDVRLAFDTGHVLVLQGEGTGAVTSIADIVEDQGMQLI